jgi:hypothetical protein
MHRHAHVHDREEDREQAFRWPLPLGEHPALELESDFAKITILPVPPGEEPRVELQDRGHRHRPHVEVRGEAGVTRVTVGGMFRGGDDDAWTGRFWEPSFWEKRRWKHHFHAHLVVYVPRDVRARIRSAAAQVDVRGLSACDLKIEIDAGALVLTDVHGRLRLSTEAGKIDARGIGGTLDVATSAGAVRLDVVSLDPGGHRVRTSMGAAQVALARGMPVQIDTRTTLGSARVDFPSVRGAPAVLEIEADLGAIRVTSSGRTWTGAPAPIPASSPYRTAPVDAKPADAPAPTADAEVERILERVADGSLSPADARELLQALGWA